MAEAETTVPDAPTETAPEAPEATQTAPEWEGSMDELEDALRQRFETQDDTPPESPEDTAQPEDAEPEPGPEPVVSESPEPPFTPEQVAYYQQWDALLSNNPALAQGISDFLAGTATFAPVAAEIPAPTPTFPTAPPVDLDLDDPATRFMWETLQAQQQQLEAARQQLSDHQQFITTQSEQTSASLANRARESFKSQKELDDDELQRVEQVAVGMAILPALAKGFNPATGQYERPDTLTALERALEVAYNSIPEFQQREMNRLAQVRQVDSKRKQKLAAVSGSSGSVPRISAEPVTAEGRKAAMTKEIADLMSPGSTG